jgi:hypothetical protein
MGFPLIFDYLISALAEELIAVLCKPLYLLKEV